MGIQPSLSVWGKTDEEEALAYLSRLAARYGLEDRARVDAVNDMTVADITLRRYQEDEVYLRLLQAFEKACEETDWDLSVDWDGLDDDPALNWPYDSLRRRAGAKKTELLYPDD